MERIELKEDNQILIFYPNKNDLNQCDLIFHENYEQIILLIQIYHLDDIDSTHSYLIYQYNNQQFLYSEYNNPQGLSFSTDLKSIQNIHSTLESLPYGIGDIVAKVFHFLKMENEIQSLSLKKNIKTKV